MVIAYSLYLFILFFNKNNNKYGVFACKSVKMADTKPSVSCRLVHRRIMMQKRKVGFFFCLLGGKIETEASGRAINWKRDTELKMFTLQLRQLCASRH